MQETPKRASPYGLRAEVQGELTSHLCAELKCDTEHDATDLAGGREDLLPCMLGLKLLRLNRGHDVEVLRLDKGVVGVAASVKTSEGLEDLVIASLHREPTGRLGQEKNEETEGNGRNELTGDEH